MPNQQCHSIDGIESANLVQLYCLRGPLNHVHTYRLMQLCLYASTQQPNTMTSTIHQNNSFLLHKNAQYFTDEILLSLYLLCIHTHTPSFNPGTWLSQFHNVKPIWVLPQQETMEVAVCNGNSRTCKHPVRSSTPTNQHLVVCPSCQVTESKFVSTTVQCFPPTDIFIITVTNCNTTQYG